MSEFQSESPMNSINCGSSELINGDVATMMENLQNKKTTTMLNRLNSSTPTNSVSPFSSLN